MASTLYIADRDNFTIKKFSVTDLSLVDEVATDDSRYGRALTIIESIVCMTTNNNRIQVFTDNPLTHVMTSGTYSAGTLYALSDDETVLYLITDTGNGIRRIDKDTLLFLTGFTTPKGYTIKIFNGKSYNNTLAAPQTVNKYDLSDFNTIEDSFTTPDSAQALSFYANDNYFMVSTSGNLYRCDLATMTFEDSVTKLSLFGNNYNIKGIVCDSTYVYVCGNPTEVGASKIAKVLISDLSIDQSVNVLDTGRLESIEIILDEAPPFVAGPNSFGNIVW